MLLQLAWRNIWRNKRRTFITTGSILFAVLFSSFMEAIQKGAWNNMINNVVNFYVGYTQVHANGYWEDQTLDKAFLLGDELEAIPRDIKAIRGLVPRLESFALASTGDQTFGVLVVGTDPGREENMTHLSGRLEEGAYLDADDQAVLVAAGVAERLKLGVGDTLLLISQGFRGVNAAGKYPVKGMVRFPSPDLNKQLVYLPLPEAQWFFGAENRVTSVALNLEGQAQVAPAMAALENRLDTAAYEIMDWKAMMPDLLEAKALDSAGNVIVYIILYMIIAFGIFGTILMMTKEREYEFGILVAIGMRKHRLAVSVWLEILMLGLLGSLAGILVSIPVVKYFQHHPLRFSGEYAAMMEKFGFEPVFPAEFNWMIFLTQALIVLAITLFLGLFPFRKIGKLEVVDAMHQ